MGGLLLVALLLLATIATVVTAKEASFAASSSSIENQSSGRISERKRKNLDEERAPETAAVRALLGRLLDPSAADAIELGSPCAPSSRGNDAFEISQGSCSGKIAVRGSSTSALTAGIGWYLKYGANVTLEWGEGDSGGRQRLRSLRFPLPALPPGAAVAGRMESPVKWRHYMNVCTLGYSTVWWGWDRWEEELDWMALRGINLPLAFVGQELVWERVFLRAGLNQSELDDFFSGPAFLPWQRMGNMRHFGGPLPRSWMQKTAELQKKILGRMRALGMTPVLPAFAGHVPRALSRIGADVIKSPNWLSFPEEDCCVGLLRSSDWLFPTLGRWAIEEMRSLWGERIDGGMYLGDTFNEMNPPSFEPSELRGWGEAVFRGIAWGDKDATWILQGWLFLNQEWTLERMEAYLSGPPRDRILVLDLHTDNIPQWKRMRSFGGRPWVWNMLENFGGRRDLQGNMTRIATGPVEDLAASKFMVGIGATPEAIENNLAMFDILFEMGWRSLSPNVTEWVDLYATRRYGSPLHESASMAWNILQDYVFSAYLSYQSPIEQKPSLNSMVCPGNSSAYVAAWHLLAEAATSDPDNEPLMYDLVDVGRQVLVNVFGNLHSWLIEASGRCALTSLRSYCDVSIELVGRLLDLISDLDDLMATNANFLLGRWIEAARSWADDETQSRLYISNAKNQITWWGPDQNIRDYASKPWAGLLRTYYKDRWGAFLAEVLAAAKERKAPNIEKATASTTAAEESWLSKEDRFSTEPHGDTLVVTGRLLKRYGDSEPLIRSVPLEMLDFLLPEVA